ncbi:FAD-dependent oxidoreductase [Streptomyces sp. FXJ1.172]|uniref:FAD-dependent oxidoreductase n=1 Tax=Streptomyces sp. FXJ1.172 TaxID=710705 RepID=UPI0007CFBD5F|nr:FAD-dependent oxidoreductase [Streptomyces sp. FXJ1.172]WEP00136.1 FAD-dependent oxidoreductase [Streptomyces sp. FXJ1.172]
MVVGAGPAGLTAAARLAAAGAGRVEVLEREPDAGGVPRHCAHGGFGTLTQPMTGPGYARRLAAAAERAGAVIRTGVTVLDWGVAPGAAVAGVPRADPAGAGQAMPAFVAGGGMGQGAVCAGPVLHAVGPGGPETVEARAVVLATGARERPRTARLVPGTRPAGVYTTGELQQAVHLFGQYVGTRAVVVGAEPVSCAAAETVRAAGAGVVALVTEQPRAQVPFQQAQSARLWHRTPLLTDTTVAELLGHGRLSGVRVRHRDGRTAVLSCDTVVFTGDFIPDHELARRGALALDPGTRGPAVDGSLHTSRPGVFAAGNVLHAVEPAGAAAREGARAARAVLGFLAGAAWPGPGIPLTVEAPLRWIAPNRIAPADRPERYVLRTAAPLGRPVLHVRQDGRLLHRERPAPGTALLHRALTLTARWHDRVDPGGGEVRVSVR